jgi:hypothetical protein
MLQVRFLADKGDFPFATMFSRLCGPPGFLLNGKKAKFLCLIKHYNMQKNGGTAPSILTSALNGLVSFTPWPIYPTGERASCTHCIGGWVGPRVSLDAVETQYSPKFS